MIEGINNYFRERLGFCVEKSALVKHAAGEWEKFAKEHCPGADGVYLIRGMTAHVQAGSAIDIFHEYFGHGLYIERSLPGKKLYSLEQTLLKEERKAGIKARQELEAFHEQSNTCRQIEGLMQKNIAAYEGFALWMEWHLSMLTGDTDSYEKRLTAMPLNKQKLCSDFVGFSQRNTDYALLYANGFPKYYGIPILNEIVRNVFRDDIQSIDFALAYGSGKPYSDIDLFIVSDKIPCFFTGWLDVYSVPHARFNELLSKLDISVTDALMTGKFVYGDNELFENAREKALRKKITQKAISFHERQAGKAKELSEKCKNPLEKRNAARYAVSYALNVLEMKNGRKPLTLKALMKQYPEDFANFEKPKPYIC